MHTLKIIAAGFVLLGLCTLIGRAQGARIFLPFWFLAAAVNMWVGVTRAGYSVADEAPVFLIVFAVPAAAALLLLWTVFRT